MNVFNSTYRSLFTFQQPQQPIYAAVMCFASVLFVAMTWILHNALAPMIKGDEATSSQLNSNFRWGISAFVGLALHALIPLQSNIVEVALGKSKATMTPQSAVHQVTSLGPLLLFLHI